MKNIALIGMMGASKTSSGRLAAQILNIPFVDADDFYEWEYNEKISGTFEKYGEKTFRDRETSVIKKIAGIYGGKNPNAVIALGGGAVLKEENVLALRENAIIIALTARPEIILKRVSYSKDRPLLKTPTLQSVTKIFDERKPLYEKYADHTIDTSFLTTLKTAHEIVRIYKG